MIPTYVFGFPSGKEQGDFLAVDLGASGFVRLPHAITSRRVSSITFLTIFAGGTNLRVCLVNVQGDGKFEITQSKYRLSEEQKQDEGQKLFDFVAESLKTFIDTNVADPDAGLRLNPGEQLPLGFTV